MIDGNEHINTFPNYIHLLMCGTMYGFHIPWWIFCLWTESMIWKEIHPIKGNCTIVMTTTNSNRLRGGLHFPNWDHMAELSTLWCFHQKEETTQWAGHINDTDHTMLTTVTIPQIALRIHNVHMQSWQLNLGIVSYRANIEQNHKLCVLHIALSIMWEF